MQKYRLTSFVALVAENAPDRRVVPNATWLDGKLWVDYLLVLLPLLFCLFKLFSD